MANCFRCGISDEAELLFDAISNHGLVKICKKCSEYENFPLIDKSYQDKPEKTKTVYERLSRMANLDAEKHRSFIKNRDETIKRQRIDKSLKDVIDEKFSQRIFGSLKARKDLIENFHWLLMRVRRAKKITQKQLAEIIEEPELAIKMAEEGFIADNSDTLVRKLENYFKIRLFREGSPGFLNQPTFKTGVRETFIPESPERQRARENFEKEANFDIETSRVLTIADLQEINRKKESGSKGLFSFFRRKKEEKKSVEKKELSDMEADEILFGKNN